MKKLIILLPLCGLLTGCPGRGREGEEIGIPKQIYIDRGIVCFSIDKKDILTRYDFYSNEGGENRLAVTQGVELSYPDTCIKIDLKTGYQYSAFYSLNSKSYFYQFFIDNNWNILATRSY